MTHPIVSAARELIGKPFRHRGRGPKYYDCAGHVLYAIRKAGVTAQDRKVYGREPWRDGLRQAVQEALGNPHNGEWRPGMIALIAWNVEPHHLAVIGDYPYGGLSLIHTYQSVMRVCEHRLDATWKARILEVYACPAH